MLLQLGNILPDVSVPQTRKPKKLRPVIYFTLPENKGKTQNRCIWGVILDVTSPKATSTLQNGQNKKPRNYYQTSKAYHRWFLCADMMNPPHTFVIITHSYNETHNLCHHVGDQSLLGLPFYVIEPKLSTSRMNDYWTVIHAKERKLIPLRSTATIPQDIVLPADGEQTFYFCLEGHRIRLATMDISFDCCIGYQCDRQKGGDNCQCVKSGNGNKFVCIMDIEYEVDSKLFKCDTHVTTIASFNTASVFYDNLRDYASKIKGDNENLVLERRRSQFRKMIKYINERGGFKLIGWCKKGMIQAEGEVEKVVNTEVKLHLTSVYPQDESILDDAEFKSLQITVDHSMEDQNLNNLESDSSDSSCHESDRSDYERDGGGVQTYRRPPSSIAVPVHDDDDISGDNQNPVAHSNNNSNNDDDETVEETVDNLSRFTSPKKSRKRSKRNTKITPDSNALEEGNDNSDAGNKSIRFNEGAFVGLAEELFIDQV